MPESAGGSVDILLGIQYASLFPKLVHMLPCGLGFYKLKLEAPGVGFNGCITGPHETLVALSTLYKDWNNGEMLQVSHQSI